MQVRSWECSKYYIFRKLIFNKYVVQAQAGLWEFGEFYFPKTFFFISTLFLQFVCEIENPECFNVLSCLISEKLEHKFNIRNELIYCYLIPEVSDSTIVRSDFSIRFFPSENMKWWFRSEWILRNYDLYWN